MGRQMSERAEFHVRGQPLDGTSLHYTVSGLDYVYLTNGFTVDDDPDYGRIVTIEDERDLHRAIGLYIITRPRNLTGAEFKFLRKQMGFKQKSLAGDLGVNEQTVANYEKGRSIPARSEFLMRLTFLIWITPDDAKAAVVKRVTERIKAYAQKAKTQAETATADAMPPADIQTAISKLWQVQAGIKPTPVCYAY
jgi:DNA-binding transcriptional regulator YiaG